MKFIVSTFVFLFSIPALAIVDMKSSNFSDNWTPLVVPGVGYDLRMNMSYSSRSLFNGEAGFGWCTDYETKIEVTPESNLKLTECGGGMEIVYSTKNFNPARVDATIKTIMAEIKRRRPDLKADYVANLEKELKTNDFKNHWF